MPDDSDEAVLAVRRLLQAVADSLDRLTAREDSRGFAAAALARNNRLLASMLALYEAGFPDVCAMPARPMVEGVLIGLSCLFGGQAAYDKVQGAYVGSTGVLHKTLYLGTGLADAWLGPTKGIEWETLTREVGKLLAARGEVATSKLFHWMLYDHQYRATSAQEIHAGVGSIGGHLVRMEGYVAVSEARQQVDAGPFPIVFAAVLHAIFAHLIFKEFGLSTAKVDALRDVSLVEVERLGLALPDDPDLPVELRTTPRFE